MIALELLEYLATEDTEGASRWLDPHPRPFPSKLGKGDSMMKLGCSAEVA